MGRICWFRCYSPQCLHRPAHFTCTRLCIPFIPWFDLPFLPQGITQWNRVRCSCGRRPLMMILVVKPSLTQTPEFAAQFRPCLRKPEDDQQLYHKTIRVIIPMLMGRHQCSATWFFFHLTIGKVELAWPQAWDFRFLLPQTCFLRFLPQEWRSYKWTPVGSWGLIKAPCDLCIYPFGLERASFHAVRSGICLKRSYWSWVLAVKQRCT